MALNLCRAIESRWKRNCASLSSLETEVILWPRSFKNCTADSLMMIIILLLLSSSSSSSSSWTHVNQSRRMRQSGTQSGLLCVSACWSCRWWRRWTGWEWKTSRRWWRRRNTCTCRCETRALAAHPSEHINEHALSAMTTEVYWTVEYSNILFRKKRTKLH